MTTLTGAFAKAAAKHRDKVALVDGTGQAFTFAQIQTMSETYAAHWQSKGVRPGDRVLIAMGIGAKLYASLAALWALGAVVVLPEPAMGLAGLKQAVRATNPRFFCAAGPYRWIKWIVPGLWRAPLLTPDQQRHTTPPEPVTDPLAIALISFTSGTTGTPKAIPRSHAFLIAQWAAVGPLLDSDGAEVDLVTFPVFVLINLAAGRTSVLPNWKMSQLDGLKPDALISWISANRCTRALIPPALCDKLIAAKNTGGLRHIFTGGGPVFPDVIAGLQAIGPVALTAVYGSTEAEPIAHLDATSISQSDDAAMAAGQGLLAGHPVDAVQLRLVDDEIQVAGDHVNKGYLDPRRDAENKLNAGGIIWHRTGDAGRIDDAGRLWLLGRIGDRVAQDDGWLYPFAIETAARMWPGVARAALLALEDQPVLVIAGDKAHQSDWADRAAGFGVTDLRHVARIPLDARHRSKVDAKALRALLE